MLVSATPALAHKPAQAAGAPQASPAAAADDEKCPPPAQIAQRLQARYDSTKNFRADFRQETTIVSVGQGEESFGTVVFMKPGRMRWEFQTPQRQSIIADGTTLWIYQPADKQVLKAPFNAAFASTTPVSFLTGVGRIKDDFTVEADPHGCNAQRMYVKLVPKGDSQMGALTLAVTRSTYDIVEAAIADPVGNLTTLSFSNITRNVPLTDDEFHFVVSEGTDVVTPPSASVGVP
jgi:outer membrane lipoprotein carrier protein